MSFAKTVSGTASPTQKKAVHRAKPRPGGRPLVQGELLTQGEIFQDERLSMDEEAAQEASEQGHPGILAGVGKSNDFGLDGVFADYGAYGWNYPLHSSSGSGEVNACLRAHARPGAWPWFVA